jgi:hypothetical protein
VTCDLFGAWLVEIKFGRIGVLAANLPAIGGSLNLTAIADSGTLAQSVSVVPGR